MTWDDETRRDRLRAELQGHAARPAAPDDWQRTPHGETRYSTPNPYALRSVAGLATDDWQAIHYETPTRAATLASDVLVPAAQSLVTGGAVAILAGVVILATHADLTGWLAVGLGGVAAAVTWFWLLGDQRRLLRTRETLTRRDAANVQPPDVLRLEVSQPGDHGAHWLFSDLPIDRTAFVTWATAALSGRSLAQSAWTGKGALFSRSQYDALTAACLQAGIVRYQNAQAHAQGVALTPAGRATLRRLTDAQGGTSER